MTKRQSLPDELDRLEGLSTRLDTAPSKTGIVVGRHCSVRTVFEDLVRRFNEENNEEAGEHRTPRDAVELMAQLVPEPVEDEIQSTTHTLYDGAAGTGGMLTVTESEMQRIARDQSKEISTHLFGQEVNAETYAICVSDMLMQSVSNVADNIKGPPNSSKLSNDAFPERKFDSMLSNPPYGKNWSNDLVAMGGKNFYDPRFGACGRPRILTQTTL